MKEKNTNTKPKHQKIIGRLKEQNKKLKTINIILLIFCLLLFAYSTFMTVNAFTYKQEVKSLEREREKNKENGLVINTLQTNLNELDQKICEVSSINSSYKSELDGFREREELFDKYNYAIIDEEGNRTYLTYDEIKYGEQLMTDLGYDPHLLFGSIMVESGGNPNAVNEYSGATGYGQFMQTTGEYIWEDVLKKGEYSNDVAKNGKNNILMMATYYDLLYKQGKDTFQVVKQYSGNSTDEGAQQYLNRINNYTNKMGVIIN